ncbi:hypothetical protein F441_05188 [Phytophthora nicotianae CJ01A1]|uniref:Uncharacterized protein n=1 Tax=Phytophthora nicotianae CJ01A1 TaxID=1317063 RepID=W2XF14_PHYNI|nr:hypothetical protein F441_05188 [Phytophthora nicotianae CJ01A1]
MERFKELTSNVKPKINETKKDESSGQVVWP